MTIKYINFWETDYNNYRDIDDLLTEMLEINVNTIVFDIRWKTGEPRDGQYDLSLCHHFCKKAVKFGFHLMPLISLFYCPDWLLSKYNDIREVNFSKNEIGKCCNVSYSHPEVIKRSSEFINFVMKEIEEYRKSIVGISICWNNEHETKYTQTHDLFRPFDKYANIKLWEFLKDKNNNISYWNNRWNTRYTKFENISLYDLFQGNHDNFKLTNDKNIENKTGQKLFDFYEFRIYYLQFIYQIGCNIIKKYKYKTYLHFGEIFTSHDSIYQGDILLHLINKKWLDIVLINTNMMSIDGIQKDNKLGYLLTSICKQYNKNVIYEITVESFFNTIDSIKYALNAKCDGIGIANLVQINQQDIIPIKNKLKYIEFADSESKVGQKRALLIYSSKSALVLFGLQKEWIESISNEPIYEFLMEEFIKLYQQNYEIDMIADISILQNISGDKYHKIVFLEPLVYLTNEKKIIQEFRGKINNINFEFIKISTKYFGYLSNFSKYPLEFSE